MTCSVKTQLTVEDLTPPNLQLTRDNPATAPAPAPAHAHAHARARARARNPAPAP